MPSNFISARALIAGAAVVLHGAGAAAQLREAPLPPPRPPVFRPAPSAPAKPKPRPAAPAEPATLPPIDPDHPPVLPAASRARMRECGLQWEAMKKAGKDEIGWRAFATTCLTR